MQVIPQFLALVAVTFIMSNANAWTDKEEVRSAFDTCFKEQGIEKPQRGERHQRPEIDKEKLDACLVEQGISRETLQKMKEKREAFREARKTCADESGDREKMHACLKEKGFDRPFKKHDRKTEVATKV